MWHLFVLKKYPKLCQKVAVLSQLKRFAGKGSQTNFLFQKENKKMLFECPEIVKNILF